MPPKRKVTTESIQSELKRTTRSKKNTKTDAPIIEEDQKENEETECSICYESYKDDYGVLKCKHTFCFNCIDQWSKQKNSCPLCNGVFKDIIHYNEKLFGRNKKGILNFKKVKIKSSHPRSSSYHAPPPPPRQRPQVPIVPNTRVFPLSIAYFPFQRFNNEYDEEDEDDDGEYSNFFFGHRDNFLFPLRNSNQPPATIDLLGEPSSTYIRPLNRSDQLVDLTNEPEPDSSLASLNRAAIGNTSIINSSSNSSNISALVDLLDEHSEQLNSDSVIDLRDNEVISID